MHFVTSKETQGGTLCLLYLMYLYYSDFCNFQLWNTNLCCETFQSDFNLFNNQDWTFRLQKLQKQAGAVPGFSAKTWCLVCFLENLISIFNWEQDEVVLLIQLRNDLFKLRRHQCFILENALMEIAMKKTLKLGFWRISHNIAIFSLNISSI